MNKLLKKYILKWTSGRATYVKELLCQMVDVFIGGWCLFSEDFPVDEEVADIFSLKASGNKQFLCGPNSFSCFGKPVADSHKVLLKDFLASLTTSHLLSFLFQRFLRMSLDEGAELVVHQSFSLFTECSKTKTHS